MVCIVGLSLPVWSIEIPSKSYAALKSQEFREREAAELELLAWGRRQPEPAMTELLRQSRVAEDPEVRERCLSVLRDLVTDQYLKDGDGYIGISMQSDTANVPGDPKPCSVIRVTHVAAGSAGERAGLQLNDLIAGLNDQFWHEGPAAEPFSAKIRGFKPGAKVTLKILRGDKLMSLDVVLGKRPPSLNNLFLNGQSLDPEAIERADREAYFRRWLSERKLPG
ncbi:MAG: PDZ domain-containing protein [Luteolibacter sp.]